MSRLKSLMSADNSAKLVRLGVGQKVKPRNVGFADKLIIEVVSGLVVLWVLRGLRLRRLCVLAKRLAHRAMPSPSVRVFFGGKTKSPCFDLSIHWLIKQIMNTKRTLT